MGIRNEDVAVLAIVLVMEVLVRFFLQRLVRTNAQNQPNLALIPLLVFSAETCVQVCLGFIMKE